MKKIKTLTINLYGTGKCWTIPVSSITTMEFKNVTKTYSLGTGILSSEPELFEMLSAGYINIGFSNEALGLLANPKDPSSTLADFLASGEVNNISCFVLNEHEDDEILFNLPFSPFLSVHQSDALVGLCITPSPEEK